ncbi:nuclear transport factor 2 family protein [Rossellomorea vietnamensis]|uniref:nuclear transport factor 2 family protein n=1 Tax=Rossellomorea vietnamensis TaxID=218284 RepID=UPI001CC99718|nr:nuclear transport factor 2 family protein [Rossellomorea vietnamensis]MCA0149807.1 nuclear transport factor 2 family protein [Rossellomorea vietnamensis]
MDNQSFRTALDAFLRAWENSSLIELETFISVGYQAREVRDGDIEAFGYEESVEGWKQGFSYVKGQQAEWDIREVSIIPMKEDERMVILYATIVLDGKPMETGNMFFDTFKKREEGWKLVRSYIETGVVRGS